MKKNKWKLVILRGRVSGTSGEPLPDASSGMNSPVTSAFIAFPRTGSPTKARVHSLVQGIWDIWNKTAANRGGECPERG